MKVPMKSNEGLCARCGAARHQDSLSACAFPRSCVIRRNRFSLARVKGTSNVCASVKTPSVSRDEPASGVLLKRKRLRSKPLGARSSPTERREITHILVSC
jgi:hypothetical protein